MKQREKTLLAIVSSILGLLMLVVGGRAFLIRPLQKVDKQTAVLRDKLEKIKAERRAGFAAEDSVKRIARITFSDQIDQASAQSGEMVTKQIILAGLPEADFSRMPVGPRRLRGAHEIGWSIQGQGKLTEVLNLAFLLQESPYLHRIENLTISAGDSPGHVRVGFRFLTLVVDPSPIVENTNLISQVEVEGPQRRRLDGIVTRDLLRPYVKRSQDAVGAAGQRSTVPSGPEGLRIVSLSDWMGHPEVHVRDLLNQKTLHFQPGDSLAGGTIVMVDYRPKPMPAHEGLTSFSRVIVKVGSEYWAIERGQTLAEKYRLTDEQLPEQLSKL